MSARSSVEQQTPHPHLSPYQTLRNNFGAGAIALSTSFAVMHPLDTLKTRMQAASKSSSSHSNLTLKSFFTRDTLKTLRRGFTTSVLGAAAQGGLRWMTFDACKTELCARFPEKVAEAGTATGNGTMRRKKNILPSASFMLTSAASAIAGDLASSIVKVPREVVTARLQTGHYDTPTHSQAGVVKQKPKGATYAVRTILRSEGIPGLFRGFWSLTLRDWPFMIILFTTYDTLKSVHHNFAINNAPPVPDGTVYTHEIPTLKSTLFGGLAGGLAAFVPTPFDVIRARIMTFKAAPGTGGATTPNMRQISGMILREHVAKTMPSISSTTVAAIPQRTAISMIPAASRAFFVGAAPRTVWWFCVCSMFFPIVERCKEGFDDVSV